MRHRLPLLLLFFASGAAGLIAQVVWVRHIALAFGSTVQSAALVTAVFLGGLGVGGLFAGKWADRRSATDAVRAYAAAEFALGVLGVGLALVLPWLAAEAGLGGTVADERGWQVLSTRTLVWRWLMVDVLIGPSALVMGATLTLLVRGLVDAEHAGLWVGWLYGLNTLGAAVGALLTDLWLVPALGLFGTLCAAASLNVFAGIAALALVPTPQLGRSRPPPEDSSGGLLRWTAAALFLAGFAAMGTEMAWLRFLSGALGPYRAVFSTLIAVMLAGLFTGSALFGLLVDRLGRAAQWFGACQALFAATMLWGLFAFDPEDLVRAQRAVMDAEDLRQALFFVNLEATASVVWWPSVALGASFPLANALVQNEEEALGRRAGWLYLATTAGNVTGALAAGFVLLPGIGIQSSALLFASVASLAGLGMGGRGALGLVGLFAVSVAWMQPPRKLLWASFPANRVEREGLLAVDEGREQIIVVTGRPEGPARLWTGGHPMTSTSPHAQRYMRLLAHLPLLLQDEPERVAVICFGVGNTLSAAAQHDSVAELHAIDLSRDVLRHGHLFEHANDGVLHDPRLTVFVDDGRHHLRRRGEPYDLITLEPPPIAHAGISALYSVEFYEAARARLSETGAISQWLPAYQVPEAEVRALISAFATVFPDGVVLVGSGREMLLVAGPPFSLEEVQKRIDQRPAVARDLATIGAPDAVQLAASFLGPVTADAAPLTDDRPTIEYSQVSHVMETRLPADLFAPRAIDAWCPDCRQYPSLTAIGELAAKVTRTEAFLSYSNLRDPQRTDLIRWQGAGPEVDLLWQNPAMAHWLWAPAALVERAMELHQEGRRDAAWSALNLASQQAPGDPHIADLQQAWLALEAPPSPSSEQR